MREIAFCPFAILAMSTAASAAAEKCITALPTAYHYINGAFRAAACAAELKVVDSSTEELLCRIPAGTVKEADAACEAAAAAFPYWSGLSLEERCRYVAKLAAGMKQRTKETGLIISRELGMPIKFATMIQAARKYPL